MPKAEESVSSARSAGDSLEQRQAEKLLVTRLGERLGVKFDKKRLELPDQGWFEIDGVSESPPILCEAWAHQGKPKSAQVSKVMKDAMKLLFAARFVNRSTRMILLFGDKEAAKPFTGRSWMAQALRTNGIEVQIVELSKNVQKAIRKAQKRQFR